VNITIKPWSRRNVILTVRILTGSPEAWQEVEASDLVVKKRCLQCEERFDTRNLDQKYCSTRCKWDAQNDRRSSSTTPP
jgi:hypothetical protein